MNANLEQRRAGAFETRRWYGRAEGPGMITSRMNVGRWLGPGAVSCALLCTLLADGARAQELDWTEPSLDGAPPARCCAPIVYDVAMGATLLFGGDDFMTT